MDDLVDFTPEIRQMAIEAVAPYRIGPLYTPHSLRDTIVRPGFSAGSWGGAAVDPETGMTVGGGRVPELIALALPAGDPEG